MKSIDALVRYTSSYEAIFGKDLWRILRRKAEESSPGHPVFLRTDGPDEFRAILSERTSERRTGVRSSLPRTGGGEPDECPVGVISLSGLAAWT